MDGAQLVEWVVSMVLPASCPACGAPGAAPCPDCIAAMRPAPALPPPRGLDGFVSLLAYDGPGRELLARLKYRNQRDALRWLAASLASSILRAGLADVDVVTWAPTSEPRRRERGFDQAELLARAVSRRLPVPCRPLLVRSPGPAQTGRSVDERRAIGHVFTARGRTEASVLLIDDVVTTGATLSAAAVALRLGGAVRVVAAAAGRTPARSALH
ncbi:MAG TPA: hypothetical protein VMY34_00235 [Acidimicrobiales bacterium]|nr:hypothetical protein [Acidimicrobiales bacterium]